MQGKRARTVLLHEIPEIIFGERCAKSSAFDLQVLENEIVRLTVPVLSGKVFLHVSKRDGDERNMVP